MNDSVVSLEGLFFYLCECFSVYFLCVFFVFLIVKAVSKNVCFFFAENQTILFLSICQQQKHIEYIGVYFVAMSEVHCFYIRRQFNI